MANNGVLRAWSLPASGQPFEERWSAAERQLMKFGAIMPLPMSDKNLALAFDMIKKLQPAPPPPPPAAMAAAMDERFMLATRYHRAHGEVREYQQQLRRGGIARDPLFRLLELLPGDWDSKVFQPVSMDVGDRPRHATLEAARAEVAELAAKVTVIEGFRATLAAALSAYERSRNPDPAFQLELSMALYRRIELLETNQRKAK